MLIEKKLTTKVAFAIASLLVASSSFAEDYTASCSTAGFTGTAYISAFREGPRIYITNTGYQIKAPAADQHLSTAKISVYQLDNYSNKPTPWRSTRPNLKQDDRSHPLNMQTYMWTPSWITQYVKFDFASSTNTKPTCTASIKLSLPQ